MPALSTPDRAACRGRFAPSPTGELHMGSLVAAVASWLEARTRGGEWLLRIEDLDTTRVVPGSVDHILRTLDACGLEWDGEVVCQSARRDAYEQALEALREAGHVYACGCSRSDIAAAARRTGPEGPVYPGTCRNGLPQGSEARAWRFRVPAGELCFEDRVQGRVCQDVATDIGDFVVRRADGFHAYQLAVVVDDAWQGVTDVVRGADLLLSTPRQLWLQRRLGLPAPGYLHVPLLLDAEGRKLSKQARSLPVDPARPAAALYSAFRLLQQAPPPELARANVPEIHRWALEHWQPEQLRGLQRLPLPKR